MLDPIVYIEISQIEHIVTVILLHICFDKKMEIVGAML
jgi:hypothetical protein